jgi:hypothetical protein
MRVGEKNKIPHTCVAACCATTSRRETTSAVRSTLKKSMGRKLREATGMGRKHNPSHLLVTQLLDLAIFGFQSSGQLFDELLRKGKA